MRAISLLLLALAFFSSAFGQHMCKQVLFTDDFSSAGPWQFDATGNIYISNGAFHIDSVYCSTYNRIYQPIGVTLADNYWRAEVDFHVPGTNPQGKGVGTVVLALTAGNLDFISYDASQNYLETNQDGVGIVFSSAHYGDHDFARWNFLMEGKKGNVRTFNLATSVYTVPGTYRYYLRLERTSPGMLEMGVFLDAGRTVHAPGSPTTFAIDPTITGLNVIQHGTSTPGNPARLNRCVIDNDYICGMPGAVGVEEVDAGRILVYPNPATEAIRIAAKGLEGIGSYSIMSLLGVEVMGGEWEAGDAAIDVAGLADGVYLVKWANGDGVYWGRFRKGGR